ncbi:hypothetical protein RirG_219140 [Rhizophagus irregularis DAOM 197198w]|nr:hypothetical protein RirG_219140 [Rhizophagus irregularis DAOM 197198w]
MVNKHWCETVIPILWKNPWNYNINYRNKSYLFAIITFYLSDDIKEFLTRQEIQLHSISSKSLFFDYLSFCRSINVNIINALISTGTSLAYNQFLLQQEFYSLFMKKCPELKYLDMKSIKHQIFYFPEANSRLESLFELECDTSIDSLFFYGLARFCRYIQRIIIVNVDPNPNHHGIVKLIEVQKNLRYFEWIDDFDYEKECFTDDFYKEIFLELKNKADTLNHFKLFYNDDEVYGREILQEILQVLHKLKTLIINDLGTISEYLLKTLIYNDLEILNINYITINEASIIIENSGGQLKVVLSKPYYRLYNDDFDEGSLMFIRKVYENCPLIEVLSLAFSSSKKHFAEFEILLNVCQNLKSLLLIIRSTDIIETGEKILENGEELLKVLIRAAPKNLRELRFFNNFKFSLEALDEFLGKWKGCALSILTSDIIYEEENYKKLINKYKNKGVIKSFRCESFMNVEDMNFKI